MDFDQKAKDWDKDPQRVERARIFANEIIKFLGDKKPENALEFGSGTGLVSFWLKDYFKSITLADNSVGMMEVLNEKIKKEKISNMKPLLLDIFKGKSDLSDFDIIYTLLTLHHIKDIDKTFAIFNTMLSHGGYLCIGDLVTEDGSFHHKDPEFDGHKGFDPTDIKNELIKNGFIIEVNMPFFVIEHEYHQVMKKYPLFIIIAKKLAIPE
jgi:ubiquinone/menaquinone biosynthesis C-methylase UbiE